MAQKEPGDDRPSLEMPSLGFGRKRRGSREPEPVEPERAEPVNDAPVAPAPAERAPEPAPAPVDRPTSSAPPLFVDETPTAVTAPVGVREAPVAAPEEPSTDSSTDAPRRARRGPVLPQVGGMVASVVTGVVVGLVLVVLSWASLRLCELVRGTSSCGGPGVFLLLAILLVMVLAGSALLQAFGVEEARSTSVLGVGLIAVVTLLFLAGVLFSWWMALVIPAVGAGSFALAHWVSTAFVDPGGSTTHR